MVVAHEPGGFPAGRLAEASRYILATDRREGPEAIRAVPLTNAPGLLSSQQTATTLIAYIYIDPSLGESESQSAAERFASGLKRATGAEAVEVTGSLPATRAETDIANRDILWVELVTMLLVVGILTFYFRSIGVPLLGLGARRWSACWAAASPRRQKRAASADRFTRASVGKQIERGLRPESLRLSPDPLPVPAWVRRPTACWAARRSGRHAPHSTNFARRSS